MNKQNALAMATAAVATYQPPRTVRTSVQTEGGICAATSVDIKNDNSATGEINEHEINNEGPAFNENIGWDD